MIGKLVIGALVVGVGYLGYQAYKKSKGSGLPGALMPSNSALTPQQMDQIAAEALKASEGTFQGCMGCLGAPPVRIL